MRRLLSAALLLALLAGCEPTAPYEGPEPATPGRRVTVIGDSITRYATPWGRVVNSRLDHPFTISWNGVDGATVPDHMGHIEWAGATEPDIIVIALGTNDARKLTTAEQAAAIDRALDATDDAPCVMWVNVRSEIGETRAKYDDLLEARVRGEGRRLLDWDAYSDGHPEWINPDGVHLTWQASEVYAGWLSRRMIEGCQ
jgi:hypothetical protein